MNPKEETHFICGNCGACYFNDEQGADECCLNSLEINKLHKEKWITN